MTAVVARLDDWGLPAWIGAMVLGFVLWWPLGLGLLVFLIWSGRMACGRRGEMSRWQNRMTGNWQRNMDKWGAGRSFPSSGNRAFDEYRAETIRRLEDEEREFRSFVTRLRMAKDRAEFDQFMAERRPGPQGSTDGPGSVQV